MAHASALVPPSLRAAKLRPRCCPDDLVIRPRLDAVLDLSPTRLLTLVVAGAGFGKTTALAELATRHAPAAWYALDAADRDLPTFLAYLGCALNVAVPGAGRRIASAARDQVSDVPAATTSVLLDLEQVDRILLVFDDFQTLGARSAAEAVLADVLVRSPQGLHVVIASRRPVALPVARLRASDDLLELGAETLRFDHAESAALLGLPSQQARVVHDRTEGWPAALRLLRQVVAGGGGVGLGHLLEAFAHQGGPLYDYLAEEALAAYPAADTEALEQAAILDVIDWPGLEVLLGGVNASRALDLLGELPGLARPVAVAEQGYEYHQLFREFLLGRLARRAPERLAVLRARAAQTAERNGRWAEAGRYWRAAGDAAAVRRLLGEHGEVLAGAGQFAVLGELVESLPDWQGDPELQLLHGQVLASAGEQDGAILAYTDAARGFQASGNRARWATAVSAGARMHELQGRFALARAEWEGALAETEAVTVDPSTRADLLRGQANALLQQGDYRRAIVLHEAALRLFEEAGNHARAAIERHNLGFCAFQLGEFGPARAWYDSALAVKRRLGQQPSVAFTLNNLAMLHHAAGDSAAAREALDECLEIAAALDLVLILAYALGNLGDIERDAGNLDEARALYERSLELKERLGDAYGRAFTWAGLADLERMAGHSRMALRLAEQALASRRRLAGAAERLRLRLAHARALVGVGSCAAAERELADVVRGFTRLDAKQALVGALVDWAAARAAVGTATDVVLNRARALGGLPGLSASFERALRAYPGLGQAEQAEMAPRPRLRPTTIEVRSFGGFGISRSGSLLPERAWRRRHAKVLLVALLLSGSAGLDRERLIDRVWPEAAPDSGDALFYQHLRVLREVLEPEFSTSGRSGYVGLVNGQYVLTRPINWDYADFRRLVIEADRPDAPTAILQAALELYRGELLPEPMFAECEWLFVAREQARADALRVYHRQADHLLAVKHWQAAMATCQRTLAVDPLDEHAHRGVIRAQLGLGRRADAEEQYRLCRDLLRHELDVEPAAETRALLR